eukprot:CAMPEP_0119066194 /NCGR_PEP_ID=MMETSP1178-20130426/8819_1 /TAXON_ID=33656 /ORGANISM="unid sp, Strain CCMP2000" /LENGTH=115 /DNA_ID=CAMNT_0007047775 /DNA_START=51 /DNA_END=398 /DNA_ORIENTATION=-
MPGSSRDSSATFRRSSLSSNFLKMTFERYDADKDGFMVLDEFYEAMQDLIAKNTFPGVHALTKDESDEIFLDCDRDDDGQLSLAEFKLALGGEDEDDVDGDAETDFRIEDPAADD